MKTNYCNELVRIGNSTSAVVGLGSVNLPDSTSGNITNKSII